MIHAAAETCQNKYALLEVSREVYGDFFLLFVCTTVAGERRLFASAGLEPLCFLTNDTQPTVAYRARQFKFCRRSSQ